LNRIAASCIFSLLLCLNGSALGEEFLAKVIVVIDGDTVLIRRASGLVKIRLAEIDAPEKTQSYGEISKLSLTGMVLGQRVKVNSQAVDQYGRLIAQLRMNGLDVNAEQIRRGMAWEYSNYHSNLALVDLQDEAKRAQRGLWLQSDPTPPWVWRKLHPSIPPGSVDPAASTHADDAICGKKKYCSEMVSCDEAKFYLVRCGLKSLDGNGDGTPCESLCAPEVHIKN